MYKYISSHLINMEEIARGKVVLVGGGSYYFPIPFAIAKIMGFEKGTAVRVYRNGNRIIYEKCKEQKL